MIKKPDIIFIATPFMLTAFLVFIGYRILIATTPEARVTPVIQGPTIEILQDGNIPIITPQVPLPQNIQGPIVSIPQSQSDLDKLIATSTQTNATVIYLSIPVTMAADNSFSLGGVENSSEENITRWAKKTISEIHKNNYHTVLTLTLSASTTVKDPAAFAVSYAQFADKWARLSSEQSVAFFSPGITVNHPLYSNLEEKQFITLLNTVEKQLKKSFNGLLGVGFCCSDTASIKLSNFSYITALPTPEFDFETLKPALATYKLDKSINYILYYDRYNGRIASDPN